MASASPRLTSLTLLLLLTVSGAASAQSAFPQFNRARVSPEGPFLYWRDRRVSYVVDSEGCPDSDLNNTRAAVVRAFNAWEGHACSDIYFDFSGVVEDALPGHRYDETNDVPDQRNLIVWLQEWPWDAERVAQTRIIWNERTGEILDADIFLNARDYYWTTAGGLNVTDIENVLAHEIGHLLGFAHTTDPDATMYDGYVDGETTKRDPSETDVEGLCAVYPVGEPTPDVPVLADNDPELTTTSCSVGAAPASGVGWGAVLLLALLARRRLRHRRQ